MGGRVPRGRSGLDMASPTLAGGSGGGYGLLWHYLHCMALDGNHSANSLGRVEQAPSSSGRAAVFEASEVSISYKHKHMNHGQSTARI